MGAPDSPIDSRELGRNSGGGGKEEPLTPPTTPSEEERTRPNPVILSLLCQENGVNLYVVYVI